MSGNASFVSRRILVLDPHIANQIAAGEVVERPASVVKELVENALDAHARRITVEIVAGGTSVIRVSDDGAGIPAADLPVALQRHATSKIRSADDLFRLSTLGFRGEALPSIAAVSRLRIASRTRDAEHGRVLTAQAGRVIQDEPAGLPPGTSVTVEDLFFNTPARLKFLKSQATETSHVAEAVTRLALCHPQTAFRLLSDGKELLATPGRGDRRETVGSLFGSDLARRLLPLADHGLLSEGCRIEGFVSRPEDSRASRNAQHFFVNDRPVKTLPLRYALEEAYRSLIPSGRFPAAFVWLSTAPELVDVNVHPAKLEVRFQREHEVKSALYHAVRQALRDPSGAFGEAVAPSQAGGTGSTGAHVRETGPDWAPPAPEQMAPFRAALDSLRAAQRHTAEDSPTEGAVDGEQTTLDSHPSLRPIGQLARSYILAEEMGGLVIIDQHAAHERVFFELMSTRAEAPATQPLLEPVVVDLAPPDMALWHDYAEAFRELGLEAEPFGTGSVIVRSVPAVLGRAITAQTVRDALDYLRDLSPGSDPLARARSARAALAACKAAIKAREPLHLADMEGLIAQLLACREPFTCPHGRPTLIRLTAEDLARRFGRSRPPGRS